MYGDNEKPVYSIPEIRESNVGVISIINRILPLSILVMLVLVWYILASVFSKNITDAVETQEAMSIERCMKREGYNVYKNPDFKTNNNMKSYSVFYKSDNAQIKCIEFINTEAANSFFYEKIQSFQKLYKDARVTLSEDDSEWLLSEDNTTYYLKLKDTYVLYAWTLCGETEELNQIIKDLNEVIDGSTENFS